MSIMEIIGQEETTMEPVPAIEIIKTELNRKLKLAREYGYPEYEDEILILLEKLDTMRKGGK